MQIILCSSIFLGIIQEEVEQIVATNCMMPPALLNNRSLRSEVTSSVDRMANYDKILRLKK